MSAAISQLSYIRSVYGGDEVTDRDGLNHRSTAGPISMVGSQAHKQQAAGQQQQAETAWSLLGKMYSSQVLAYMVAITDAQALVRRMRSMRPGPPLQLPAEVQCMDVWQVLAGSGVQQRRVWTFGLQVPASLPAPASDTAAEAPADFGLARQTSQACPGSAMSLQAGSAAAQEPWPDIQTLVEPCVSSREPQSVKDGVQFISCAAGHQHSAAAAEGGYVFTWGSNDKGQLGCDTSIQQPVAIHVLDSPELAAGLRYSSSGAAGSSPNTAADAGTGAAAASSFQPSNSRAMLNKLDSLKQLGSTIRLPSSLMATLQQQRQRERDDSIEQQEQQQLLLQELLQHPGLEQQQQLSGRPPAPQPGITQAAARMAVMSGISSGLQHQQQQEGRPQALAVYHLHLGQAVRSIACGAHHTLAALASSGLMGWGSNDKGQLGAPAGLYKQVNKPMRIHGFDGQRLVCISAGAKHSAAVQEGGVVVTWGHGRYGRLGIGGTPDILPPSVVSGLRGCYITQVACGTAHTLAMTIDGRVYACGYNGQGALGTGDEQDRLYPVLVPGLPNCIQVAAAASSMALDSDGRVFLWGGAAGKRLHSAKAARHTSTNSNGGASRQESSADMTAAAGGVVQKECVPWLAGVKAVHITCGLDTAAAVSRTGEVLLWGNKQCLPASMMQQAQALAGPQQHPAAAVEDQNQQQQPDAAGVTAAALAAESSSTLAAACFDTLPAAEQQPLSLTLQVQDSGSVRVKLTYAERTNLAPTAASNRRLTAPPSHAAATSACRTSASAAEAQAAAKRQDCGLRAGQQFNPQEEPVAGLACGASHQVVLCQPSQHIPTDDEVRAACLKVLLSYIHSFNSTNTSSLNLLIQQQQLTEGNWAGSVAGGPARSIVSVKPTGVNGFTGSMVSFAGSTGASRTAAAAAAVAGSSTESISITDGAGIGSPSEMQRPCSIVRGSGPTVSFAGSAGAGADASGGDTLSAMGASIPGSTGALLFKADRVAGNASSTAVGSEYRGRGAQSVTGSQVAGSGGGRPAATAASGPASDCLSLHGVLVLCKEVGLLDNITEHLDVIQAFQLMLHRKRGRLGPLHTPKPPADMTATVRPGIAAGASNSAGADAAQHACVKAVAAPDSAGCDLRCDSPEPDVLRVVHVLRPNEPAVLKTPAADSADNAIEGTDSGPSSSGPQSLQLKEGVKSSRPGSSSMYGQRAAGRAAAAASGMDSINSVDAGEVLEMLLLLMKERHPCYKQHPAVLLQMLAGRHLTCLKGRRPDQGPCWLLRQALQPELLTAIESRSTTELLHGIYVHLAGSSANTQDLSMHLSDLRLGLKFAAGFCTPQDLQQQQQGSQRRNACRQASSQWRSSADGSSPRQLQQSGNSIKQQHSYHSSTQSSRGRVMDAVPYSISMHGFDTRPTSSKGRSPQHGSDSGCDARSFQLPLHKVAAFIRTAKLLPRLLDKYIAQLQLKGQEQHVSVGGQRIDALPVMPCLQLRLQLPLAAPESLSGQRHRLVAPTDSTQQQVYVQAEASRLAPLKEASMASSLNVAAPNQQQQQPSHGHSGFDHHDSFFEPLPSQHVGSSNRQHSVSTSSRLSASGAWGRRGTEQGGRTAREQQGGLRGKRAGLPAAARALDASMIDVSALNSAELVPIRSQTACIQLLSTTTAHTSGGRVRSTGGSSSKILLQLPPAGSTPAADAIGSGGRGGSSSGHVSQYGGAAWKELVQTQQEQAAKTGAGRKIAKTGAGRKIDNSRATFQQQQVVLQQQRRAETTSAQLAEAQEEACQDAWIACVLVELLGSSLIYTSSTTAARVPQPFTHQGAGRPVRDAAAAALRTADDWDAENGAAGTAGNSSSCEAESQWCSWDKGYCSADSSAGSAEPPTSFSGSNSSSSSSSSGVLDLLNACISYPQFVEVLLCLMAARSVSILEPDVKQIRALSYDDEMQDHARIVMERITKWRATQLTPWKQQQQRQQQQNNEGGKQPTAGASTASKLQSGTTASPALEGQQAVCRLYSAYSSIKLGSSVLGLHRDGYLQLLTDAGMVGSGSSEPSVTDAVSIFKQVATANDSPSKQQIEARPGSAVPADSSSADGGSSRPTGFGPDQRQSTFMRCATQQLLQRLQAGAPAPELGTQDCCSPQAPMDAAPTCGPRQCTEATGAAAHSVVAQHQQQPGRQQQSQDAGGCGNSAEGGDRRSVGAECCADSGKLSSSVSRGSAGHMSTAPRITRPQDADAATTAAKGDAAAASVAITAGEKGDNVLTFAQFLQAMVLLSRSCFSCIANGSRRWKLLLERHVQPLADRKRGRYDRMAASLNTPGVVALLSAGAPQLQQLHQHAAATHHASSPHGPASLTQQQQARQGQQGAQCEAGEGVLSLTAFLQVLQDKGAIPQLLEPCDVQEVLRQVLVTQQQQDVLFSSLDCSQFSHALSMCSLAAFASRRMQSSSNLQAPEQQLTAFLTFMGLRPLPGQHLQATAAGNGMSADAAAGGKKVQQRHTSSAQLLRQQLAADPYVEWWSLQFDPAAESRAHDHLSSLSYLPVMLQEVVQPPSCCPPDVLPLLSAAQSAQVAREVDGALHLLDLAEQTWRAQTQQPTQQPHSSQGFGQQESSLPPLGVLYLAVSAAGCLLSAGRDDEAVGVLQGCAEVLTAVHEAGADAAVWHAATGVAKYHCNDLRGAFEHCVRAFVIRSECGSLGARHPDTAAAGHNLGVVLDCLGKCSRGLQLVQEAQQVFTATLGPQHIRTLVAARNKQHIKHKIIRLPAQPQSLLTADKAGAAAVNGTAAGQLQAASCRQGASAQQGGSVGRGSGNSSGAKAHGAAAVARRSAGSDSDSWDSSSGDERQLQAAKKDSANSSTGSKQTRSGRRSVHVSSAGRSVQRNSSMQERLAAVRQARQVQEDDHQAQHQQQVDPRDYTDPDHLGAGVFRATTEQQQLYKAFMADIKAHAQGASSSSYSQEPGLLELQVLRPRPPAVAVAAAKGSSAISIGVERAGSARVPFAQDQNCGIGSSSTGQPMMPGCAASQTQHQLTDMGHRAPSYSAVAAKQQGMSSGACTAAATAAGSEPAVVRGAGAVRELHRGSLADATIAAIKRPLTVEQAHRLKRQQQQLAARRGQGRTGSPDLLDKIY